jgi:aspartyl-tRNA(Asn)/glutamyl-tRNA(Gln) amidotransferase subunit C
MVKSIVPAACSAKTGSAIGRGGSLAGLAEIEPMSVDTATVKRVARLARIAVSEVEAEALQGELNAILGFVEQLNEVDVGGVEPMTSVIAMKMKMRPDIVTEGERADAVIVNAPAREESFFVVPKVVE